jgi:hypothetical protein
MQERSERAAAVVGAPAPAKPAPTVIVEETANAVDNNTMLEMMKTMMREVTTLKQQVNNNNRENVNPNNVNTILGPPCKHCGKQHPHMSGHKLGTEEQCPGRDWPNHIKGSQAANDRYFIMRMNKRTGKTYVKEQE